MIKMNKSRLRENSKYTLYILKKDLLTTIKYNIIEVKRKCV